MTGSNVHIVYQNEYVSNKDNVPSVEDKNRKIEMIYLSGQWEDEYKITKFRQVISIDRTSIFNISIIFIWINVIYIIINFHWTNFITWKMAHRFYVGVVLSQLGRYIPYTYFNHILFLLYIVTSIISVIYCLYRYVLLIVEDKIWKSVGNL